MTKIKTRRIYDKKKEDDGIRILVDRLWPRGVSKEEAQLDYWLKELGPSNELRKWFNHEGKKFAQFKEKYKEELKQGDQQEAFKKLKEIIKETDKDITLLFGAKDEENNNAKVLEEVIQ